MSTTFSKEQTSVAVTEIISKTLSMPLENIHPSMTFKELGADSLDVVEMIMLFEETFGVEIKDEEAERISTVQEAIDIIHASRSK